MRFVIVVGAAMLVAGVFVACSSSTPAPLVDEPKEASTPADAATEADAAEAAAPPPVDAGVDVDAAPVVMKRVSGHVDYNGAVANATVTLLSPTPMATTTDTSGDFFFYLPLGSYAIVKVEAPNLYPMIRGWQATDPANRIRVFYLLGPPDVSAAQSLGKTFDATKGIVEMDFRNATVGGYSATLTAFGSGAIAPGFGIATDAMGNPQLATSTITGGDGTTLLFGDVMPSTVSLVPVAPADAGVCMACDAPVLPIQAGVVTWVDFEAGSANCQ